MIISPGRNYIFVHAPKTGGTSLALALETRAMADDILIGDTPKAKRRKKRVDDLRMRAPGRLWKHSNLADIDGLFDFKRMFIVTLVRNPWDRLVSYYHWLRMQDWDHTAVRAAKNQDFADFVHDPAVTQAFVEAPFGHYVTDRSGREHEALFIRLEHFDHDVRPFEAHLGFALAPLGVSNTSGRGHYRDYYDDRSRARVADICAPDIARFNYRF